MNDKLDRVVVPMPQFVNPNSPETNAGSINLGMDEHPVAHAESYGAMVTEENVAGLQSAPEAAEPVEYTLPSDLVDKPEEDWTNDDLKEALKAGDQPVSGNKEVLEKRWAEFKATLPSDEQ